MVTLVNGESDTNPMNCPVVLPGNTSKMLVMMSPVFSVARYAPSVAAKVLMSMAKAVMGVVKVQVAVSFGRKNPTTVAPRPLGGVVVRNASVTIGEPEDAL